MRCDVRRLPPTARPSARLKRLRRGPTVTGQLWRPDGSRAGSWTSVPADRMDISVAIAADGGINLTITGQFDAASAPSLRLVLDGVLDNTPRAITLDLQGITFIDASGLHTLIEASGRAREVGSSLVLSAVPDRVYDLLSLTGLTHHFRIRR